MFCEKEIRPLGFSRRGELIGEGAASGGGSGGLTIVGRGQGLGHAPGGEAGPWPCNDPRFYQILGEFFFCFYFACVD
jgi:hypothetical protein